MRRDLRSDSPVELCVIDGQIHIIPARDIHYELDALLNEITAENLHGEVDTGDGLGNEIVS